MNFKKGDTVKLKSGGPSMTIDNFKWDARKGVYLTDQIHCKWFDVKHELQSARFSADALVKA